MKLKISFSRDFAVPEDVATKAKAALQSIERGDITNPTENRMVGHYWLRKPDLAPTKEISAAIQQTIDKINSFAERERSKFDHYLLIGIGGSALGPQFLADCFSGELSCLDNSDPDGIAKILHRLNPAKTLVLVTSKSGSTRETQNGMLLTKEYFASQSVNFTERAVALTQPNSKLAQLASQEKWLATFPIWEWVGGRTSVFSAAGLLPAKLMGMHIDKMLAGAADMDNHCRAATINQDPALKMAYFWHQLGGGSGRRANVVLPYVDSLLLFPRYLQQLIMESLGKRYDMAGNEVSTGLVVYGNKGSTDQHAFVQQLRDGPDNFFVTFIESAAERSNMATQTVNGHATAGDYLFAFLRGTRSALQERGRETITITLDTINEYAIGELIALFERAVGYNAAMININAYDQPGVEAGKKSAEQVINAINMILGAIDREPLPQAEINTRLQINPLLADEIMTRLTATKRVKLVQDNNKGPTYWKN